MFIVTMSGCMTTERPIMTGWGLIYAEFIVSEEMLATISFLVLGGCGVLRAGDCEKRQIEKGL